MSLHYFQLTVVMIIHLNLLWELYWVLKWFWIEYQLRYNIYIIMTNSRDVYGNGTGTSNIVDNINV